MENAIETINLTKTFRDFWMRPIVTAVNNLDLTIKRGEIFGLLGPNGSGKSTTVKCILGLLKPNAGKVEIFGKNPRNAEIRRRLGYLPEISNLHPFLTARETLMYYAGLTGLQTKEARTRTNDLLEMVELTSAADRPVGGFSKGMARRVGLASALIGKPNLLILDEPTSGLDPVATADVKTLVKTLCANGVTILMTSHLLADVADICHRIAILSKGKLTASGEVKDLLKRPDEMEFLVKGLSPEEATAAAKALEVHTGRNVTCSHPQMSLETFFLETLEKKETSFNLAPFLTDNNHENS